MNPNTAPRAILDQIAAIDRMERGKLSVIRQGQSGSYFNLQRREGGRNVTEYVPVDQVAAAQFIFCKSCGLFWDQVRGIHVEVDFSADPFVADLG